MKKSLWAVVIIVVLVGGYILLHNKQAPVATNTEPIKIGADLSLTGYAAQDGEGLKKGLDLAQADLKKKGVSVEIIYQDDKTEPKDTISAVNALALQNVQAIVGFTWSYIADAGIPVIDRLKLVTIMPSDTSEYVSARSPYAFFGATKNEKIVPILAKWLTDNNKKTIAIIRNQGAWYESVNKAVVDAAAQAGAKVVYSESIPLGSESSALPTILAKVKPLNPDVFFAEIDDDKGIVLLIKKVKEQGITSDVMSVTTSFKRALTLVDESTMPKNNFYIISPTSSKEFNDKYQAFYGEIPPAYADRAYDSLMLLVEAIQKRGATPLADYLRNQTNYKGFVASYKFDANGDNTGGSWEVEKLK